MGGSLPFRSGVVVSLRPLSVCHGSMWLVPAFFPSLSLSFPVCAHFLLAGIFFCLLTALHPTSGSWYAGSCGFSSPLGLPTFAMGSPLQGRGLLVLDRNEGLVSPFGSGTLVSSWLDIPPLSAGICAPCHSGCVAWWSSMCPYCWVTLSSLQGSSRSLVRGLGWSFVPYPLFCRLGLVPRSVAQLCALLPLVSSFRVYLSLLCAPLAVGLLPGSPNRLCPLSADYLLGLEPSPSGVASASDGRFSWHPGAAGALAVPSLRLRVSESSSLSAWSFPLRGL